MDALNRGAHVGITGRSTDTALTYAPMMQVDSDLFILLGCSARSCNGEITHVGCTLDNGIDGSSGSSRADGNGYTVDHRCDRGTDQKDPIPYHRWVIDNEPFLFRRERCLLRAEGITFQ